MSRHDEAAVIVLTTRCHAETGVEAQVPQLPVPQNCPGAGNFRFQHTTSLGWSAVKIAGGLKQVRTIVWDTAGNMLVAEATRGISVHTFGPDGCINSTSMLISGAQLNHGLALTPDSKYLYASAETAAYRWDYDPATRTISNQRTVVQGMSRGIHFTRTIAVVPQSPNLILLQVGSNSNFDMASEQPSTGRAIIKIFDMDQLPPNGFNYNTDGEVYGYGLRNTIGFTPDPNGVFWGVENSGDVSLSFFPFFFPFFLFFFFSFSFFFFFFTFCLFVFFLFFLPFSSFFSFHRLI